jgi:hypothetical protein
MANRSMDVAGAMKTAHNFVLSSNASSTYPWVRAGLGQLGVGRVKCRYASGAFFTCGLVADCFDRPAQRDKTYANY